MKYLQIIRNSETESNNKNHELNQIFIKIIDFIPDAIFIIDRDEKILAWNSAMEELTNTKAEDVIGHYCYDYSLPLYGEKRPFLISLVLNPQKEFEVKFDSFERNKDTLIAEIFVPHLKTGDAYLWAIAKPLYDSQGNIIGAIESIRDITNQKIAEQKLKESEEKFRTAVENSPDFMVFIKADGTIFDINRLEKGFTREMVIGQSVFNKSFYETEDQLESAQKAISDTLEPGEITHYEYSQIAPDGSLSFYETRVSPFGYDNEGKIISLQLATRDITERKKAEQKLKESEERLKKFMDSATDSFILFDAKFNYVDLNKKSETMFGLNKEEVIGKNILDIVPNLKETSRYNKYLEVIKTGKPFFIDDLIPQPKFGDINLSVRAFKVGDGLGIIATDITEQKRAEEKLKRHIKELNCLYGITKLLSEPNISVDEVLIDTLELIKSALQYPELSCVQIIFNRKEYKSNNFSITPSSISYNILVNNRELKIKVYYLEEKSFLEEEKTLLKKIARQIKAIFEIKLQWII